MANTIKTPYYIYSPNKIIGQYQAFKKAFPFIEVKYALKSNPLPLVVDTLNGVGCGFEIASKSELQQLLRQDVPVQKIIYSNPIKSPEEIAFAYKKGVKAYSYDCLEELDKLAEYAPNSDVILRLRVYERGSVFSLKDKFGAEDSKALVLAKRANELSLNFIGLSFHVGSQSLKLKTWEYALRKIEKVQERLQMQNISVRVVNIGGGFPISYKNMKAPSLDQIAEVILSHKALFIGRTVYAEPGRFIVAPSADLVARVIGRTTRRGMNWLYLDAGTYNAAFEAMDFQGSVRYSIESMDSDSTKKIHYIIGGPTCDSIDTLTEDILLPDDIQVGDRLLLRDIGAYSVSLANSFNGFSQPKIYIED